jgi:hypothetical protein
VAHAVAMAHQRSSAKQHGRTIIPYPIRDDAAAIQRNQFQDAAHVHAITFMPAPHSSDLLAVATQHTPAINSSSATERQHPFLYLVNKQASKLTNKKRSRTSASAKTQ